MKKYVEIENVHAREVLDSKGFPTLEVEVQTEEGDIGRAIVPTEKAINEYKTTIVNDGDKSRYGGKGVLNAVNNVNSLIAQEIEGLNVLNQTEIDETLINLDGTEEKSKLGVNAILGVSIAVCKAAACNLQIPLYQHLGGVSGRNIPIPIVTILNAHVQKNSDIQMLEYLVIPKEKRLFSEMIRMSSEIYWQTKQILIENQISFSIGNNGGFNLALNSNEDGIDFITQAIKSCGYSDKFVLFKSAKEQAIDGKLQSISIVPSQIGTVTETIDVIRSSKSHGYSSIISYSSNETEDTFISDLAVGLNAKYIMLGAPCNAERTTKINRLIRIEELANL